MDGGWAGRGYVFGRFCGVLGQFGAFFWAGTLVQYAREDGIHFYGITAKGPMGVIGPTSRVVHSLVLKQCFH